MSPRVKYPRVTRAVLELEEGYGRWQWRLQLSCGHHQARLVLFWVGCVPLPPKHVRCRDCEAGRPVVTARGL